MTDEIRNPKRTRRQVVTGVGELVLSAGAISLLGSIPRARSMSAPHNQDVRILNVAVALEYESINAYGMALKSGLLGAKVPLFSAEQAHGSTPACHRPGTRAPCRRGTTQRRLLAARDGIAGASREAQTKLGSTWRSAKQSSEQESAPQTTQQAI